jgi:choline-sulfatase
MFLIRLSACTVLLVASALAAEAAPSTAPVSSSAAALPNIVLITVDTTRADRMGFLGSQRGLTPNLDKLASDSAVFTHAYSQAPLTAPSHASILTGTYPQFHQVSDFQLPLNRNLPYAPALLKASGYHTAAFLGALVLDPSLELAVGFDRGFDTYDAGFHMSARGETRYKSVERRGSEVVAHALAWLNDHPKGPFFIWVHLYDAHEPYDPPEPFKTQYKSAPYDGEIAYVDSVVGTLLAELRTRGLYDGTLIALMADHGESLGAHGEESHGFFLYDETIHVPLLFKLPGEHPVGERIEKPVALVDVLPTVLQTVGIEIPKEVQGATLRGLMKTATPAAGTEAQAANPPAPPPDRPLYAETDYGRTAFGWSSVRSLRTGKYLFIEAPRRELYDQAADPAAAHNLAASSKAVADTLQGRLDSFREKTSNTAAAPKSVANPESQAKLVALGYMGSGSAVATANGGAVAGVDPKDKIEIGNLVSQANFLLEDWRFDDAIPLLQKIIAREPGMATLYTKLGMSQMILGRPEAAVPPLRKVVELNPDSPDGYFNLGNAMMRAKDYEGALAQYKILSQKDPGFWEAHLLQAMANARLNRVPETIAQCEIVLKVAPDHFGTNMILGRSLLRKGDAEAAIPKLQKAASIQPQSPEPHIALANAYTALGREADATREREEGQRLQTLQPSVPPEPKQ